MITYETGIFILLACIVASRIISAKAVRTLSAEKKAEMMDKFSGVSAYGMIPLVGVIGAYFLLGRYTVIDQTVLTWSYFGALTIFIALTHFYTLKKLREMKLESDYMRKYAIARVISLSGFAVFMLAVLPV